MVSALKAAFEKNLDDLEWMDESSKAKALQKLKSMRFKVAYPDYYDNDRARFDELHNFVIDQKDFYKNVERSVRSKVNLRQVGKKVINVNSKSKDFCGRSF